MDWIWEDFITIGFIVAITILILIAYFEWRFFTIKRRFVKIKEILEELSKKLTEIESKLVRKIEKENIEKEKNREQKLMKLKNEIDEMLREGNQ
jgi:predicted Holliday junction resolvase-like endonuclease